ncbi:hypothetical protein [Sulfobacillus thermosulfidooxidans]|uniref:hypothetical protein n=1 Tax=Sulfobacillus thermosulfidooxidans TaxID=28034 RepID=UPI000B0DD1D4|nr:hypothetical protein [Sulfobacillus thermosulfidooxidans]
MPQKGGSDGALFTETEVKPQVLVAPRRGDASRDYEGHADDTVAVAHFQMGTAPPKDVV